MQNLYNRSFGIEIEANGKDIKPQMNACQTIKLLGHPAQVRLHEQTHNNDIWIIKPDNSCGFEICSPVMNSYREIHETAKIVDSLREAGIQTDNRCALHVHINVGDMPQRQIAKILAYWIKFEPIFFDSVPPYRKHNRYCRCIGLHPWFSHNMDIRPDKLIHKLGVNKYFSINTIHMVNGSRCTIEFRLAESKLDPLLVKNWTLLLLNFVETVKDFPTPKKYKSGDKWSSLLWLERSDFFNKIPLEQDLKNWFLKRIKDNKALDGIWSENYKSYK